MHAPVMTITKEYRAADDAAEMQLGQRVAAAGGVLAALAASSCCVLPLILFSFGVGGAWIGNLTSLAPYQPCFIAATIAFLGCGYWLGYLISKPRFLECEAYHRPGSRQVR